MVNKQKTIIFDFDGVIADSFDICFKMNKLAFLKQNRELNEEKFRNFFTDDLNKNFKKFCETEKNYVKYKKDKDFFRDKFYKQVDLFRGIDGIVRVLKEKNFYLYIVSATKEKLVEEILLKNKVKEFFDKILCSSGDSKVDALCEIMALVKIKKEDIFFVADTYMDIIYGNRVGFKTMAVTWGFHNEETLKKSNPDYILRNKEDIFKYVL